MKAQSELAGDCKSCTEMMQPPQLRCNKNELVFNAIQNNRTITVVELMGVLGLSKTTTEKVVKSLTEKNKIKREGPRKGGQWVVIE